MALTKAARSSHLYRLTVTLRFCAAHRLEGYAGKCSHLHGHNYTVEIEVSARQLDDIGLAMDSDHIKKTAKNIIERLDHRYLNELPEFEQTPPSAENIAKYLYEQCSDGLNNAIARVSAVTVRETENFCVRYERDDNI